MKKNYHSIPEKHYEFGFNRDLPDDHAIVNGMPDFESIAREAAQVKQRSKLKVYFGMAAGTGIAAAIALLIWFGVFTGKSKEMPVVTQNKKVESSDSLVIAGQSFSPPASLKYLQLETQKDLNLNLGQNLSIKIPAGTLVDETGKSPAGTSIIAYKLLQGAEDLLSGQVPLVIEEQNGEMALNPRFMFEVYAPGLKVAEGKAIEIEASGINSCNLYSCSKSNAVWKIEQILDNESEKEVLLNEVGSSSASTNIPMQSADGLVESGNSISLKEPVQQGPEPLKPRLRNPSIPGFEIVVDKQKYPELASYKNVVFEVKQSNDDIGFEDFIWEKITVDKTPTAGEYKVTLSDRNRTVSCIAYPVFTKTAEYRKAMAEYNKWKANVVTASAPAKETDHAPKAAQDQFRGQAATDKAVPVISNGARRSKNLKIKVSHLGMFALANPKEYLPGTEKVKKLKFTIENSAEIPEIIYQTSSYGNEKLQTSYNNREGKGWLNVTDNNAEIMTIDERTGKKYYTTTKALREALLHYNSSVIMSEKKEDLPALPQLK